MPAAASKAAPNLPLSPIDRFPQSEVQSFEHFFMASGVLPNRPCAEKGASRLAERCRVDAARSRQRGDQARDRRATPAAIRQLVDPLPFLLAAPSATAPRADSAGRGHTGRDASETCSLESPDSLALPGGDPPRASGFIPIGRTVRFQTDCSVLRSTGYMSNGQFTWWAPLRAPVAS